MHAGLLIAHGGQVLGLVKGAGISITVRGWCIVDVGYAESVPSYMRPASRGTRDGDGLTIRVCILFAYARGQLSVT